MKTTFRRLFSALFLAEAAARGVKLASGVKGVRSVKNGLIVK